MMCTFNSTSLKSIWFLFLITVTVAQSKFNPNYLLGDEVYLLTYDHGGLILWGPEHFRERLRNAVEWLDTYPGFKIGLDNEAQIYDYFAVHEPELLQEIKSYLKKYQNRFAIGSATYGQPLSVFINEESNIRQIAYARRATRKYFGYVPPVYLMSEHAMHSQIPQILNGFGFDGAIMRTHYMMYGYNPTFNVPIGWWIGLDGSRIATIPTYDGEGAEFGKTPIDNWILTRFPGPECQTSLEEYRQQFSHLRPLLATRADDSGLRREALVKRYEGNRNFKWILLDELLQIYPEPTENMVTQVNDFIVRMPWGYCGNEIWNMCRRAEQQLLTAERLAAIARLKGGPDYQKELDRAWQDLLLAQHHDVQIVGLLPEARKYLPASLGVSKAVSDSSLAYFSAHMQSDGLKQVTVFNPLGWNRYQWIIGDVVLGRGEAQDFLVKHQEQVIPVVILNSDRYSDQSILQCTFAFKADLAPLSVSSFSIHAVKKAAEKKPGALRTNQDSLIIRTPFYHIYLNPSGGISAVNDALSGEPFLKHSKRAAFFTGIIDGQECESSGRWIIHRSSPEAPWCTAREYGFIGTIPFYFEMKIYEAIPRLDCRVKFDFSGQKIGQVSDDKRDAVSPFIHEKKLRFKVFSNCEANEVGIRDLPFAIAETDNRYVEGNYWTAISDGRIGLAFFNQGTMGSVRESDGGFSIPLAYAMYYIWGTRMLDGSYSYQFALYPFHGSWREADLHREALAYNYPAVYTSGGAGDGKLGEQINTITCDAENVVLSAFYQEQGIPYARFYEAAGEAVDTRLNLFLSGGLEETDLEGNFIKQTGREVRFTPWQIRTFRIVP
jgi:alpha-mannosidase